MVIKRKYGWIPDIPDHRDLIYKRKFRLFLPQNVDLRKFCSPVENQENLGSCTAQALAGNVELLDRKLDGEHTDVSRLFIYYNEREILGSVAIDSGAYIRDGIKTLAGHGVCSEKEWPYDVKKFTKLPPHSCYEAALHHRISAYERLLSINDILACLADGFPVVFGIAIYESFETKKVAETGVVNMPKMFFDRFLGGHAVMAVGYDMKEKRFIVRNSWGEGWGQKGYFTLPFKYVERLGDDYWTIRK